MLKNEMDCPICGKRMKIRTKKINNDNFVNGKEEIVIGWDCRCGMSLDLYER